MTIRRVANSTSALQIPPSSSTPQFGRRAYGCQRQMSQHTMARNIADSIMYHYELGKDRPISHYTHDPHLSALVQAQLDALTWDDNEPVATTESIHPGDPNAI